MKKKKQKNVWSMNPSPPVDWLLSVPWMGFPDCSSPIFSSSCESSERLMLPTNSLFRDFTKKKKITQIQWSFTKDRPEIVFFFKCKDEHKSPSSRALLATFSWTLFEWPIKSKPLSDRKSISECLGSEDFSSVKLSLSRSTDRYKLQSSEMCNNNKFVLYFSW